MSISIINLRDEAEKLRGRPWQAKNLGLVNSHALKLGCAKGEYNWHKHDADEMFLVYKGKLTIQFRDHANIVLHSDEAVVIPKGVWHCPKSDGESFVLMFEPIHLAQITK
jgi:mannose-6-phosphate isomerase-like protein (cupin superfamily)